MRVYEVTYKQQDWTKDVDNWSTKVAASSAVRAAEFVARPKGRFMRYGGRVVGVREMYSSINIAK